MSQKRKNGEPVVMDAHQRHDGPECSLGAFQRYRGRERHHRRSEKKTFLWRLLKGGEKMERERVRREEERGEY